MEYIIHLCLVGVEQNTAFFTCWGWGGLLSYPNRSGNGATQLPSGEISNILDHLGETGSELKSD
jgi:hypothetical protein